MPKLVAEDIPLLFSLLSEVFPGIEYQRAVMAELKKHIRQVSYTGARAVAAQRWPQRQRRARWETRAAECILNDPDVMLNISQCCACLIASCDLIV